MVALSHFIVAFRSAKVCVVNALLQSKKRHSLGHKKPTLDKVQGQNRQHVVGRNQNEYNKSVLTSKANPKTDLVLTISA